MSCIAKILVVLALLSCAVSLTLHLQANSIRIEYCSTCGLGGPANRLKSSIISAFPNVSVSAKSADSKTGDIKVGWVKNGQMNVIWKKGKSDTENGHP